MAKLVKAHLLCGVLLDAEPAFVFVANLFTGGANRDETAQHLRQRRFELLLGFLELRYVNRRSH